MKPADTATTSLGTSLKQDSLLLGGALLYTFVLVYFVGGTLADLLLFPIIILALRSKNPYLWLVYFFALADAPGRLFSATGADDLRLPLYTFTAGFSFSFQELFTGALLLRFILERKTSIFLFRKEMQVFFFIFTIYFLTSIFLGVSFVEIVAALRIILPWTMVLLIPYFITDLDTLKRVAYLLFPFVFIAIAFQIHTFITGEYLDYILRGVESRTKLFMVTEESEDASRVYSSVFIVLICLVYGLFYYTSQDKGIPQRNLLLAVILTSIGTIFLTATRGWIVAFSIILFGTALLIKGSINLKSVFRMSLVGVLLLLVLAQVFPLVFRQLSSSLDRLSTLILLLQGDTSAGGTLSRLDVRGVKVLRGFWDSPIIGQGFSRVFFRLNDNHVGNHSLLMNLGVVGFLAMLLLYGQISFKAWRAANDDRVRAWFGDAPRVFFLALIAIFFIHSTSTQYWGFDLGAQIIDKTLTYGFLFAALNVLYRTATEPDDPDEAEAAPRVAALEAS